jgi:hypothetical protein
MNKLSKLNDLKKLSGNIVGNFQNQLGGLERSINSEIAGKLTGEITKLSGSLNSAIGGLSGVASSTLAKVQSLLSSVGSMGGQIKAPVMASGTIDTSAITAGIAKLLGDSRIPAPNFTETAYQTRSNQYIEAQSSALEKVKDVDTDIEILNLKIASLKIDSADYQEKLNQYQTEMYALNKQLVSAQQNYERILTG